MNPLPTLQQLYNGVRADLDAEFGITISFLKKVALRAYAAVHAGKLWIWYKFLALVQKNIWPDTADPVSKGGTLERFGLSRLGRYPTLAQAGQYPADVTGSIGAVIPALTTYKSNDDSDSPGYIFILDAQHVMIGTTDNVVLRALTAGTISKLSIGNRLTATKPLVNIDKTATVTGISVDPLDAESEEDYRQAILDSFRFETQGGSAADYRIWAQDAQGVKTVYPYAKSGETNANNIYIEANPADSTDGKGTPPALMITDVTNVCEQSPDTSIPINQRGRRPCSVVNYYLAITPKDIDIEIAGFVGVTAAQQTKIQTALTAYINSIRPYIPSADPLKNDIINTNNLNGVIYSAVPGAVYTGVTLKVNGVPMLTYQFLLGNIPYFNGVTYT